MTSNSRALINSEGNVPHSLSQDHNKMVLGIKLAAATILLKLRSNGQDKDQTFEIKSELLKMQLDIFRSSYPEISQNSQENTCASSF